VGVSGSRSVAVVAVRGRRGGGQVAVGRRGRRVGWQSEWPPREVAIDRRGRGQDSRPWPPRPARCGRDAVAGMAAVAGGHGGRTAEMAAGVNRPDRPRYPPALTGRGHPPSPPDEPAGSRPPRNRATESTRVGRRGTRRAVSPGAPLRPASRNPTGPTMPLERSGPVGATGRRAVVLVVRPCPKEPRGDPRERHPIVLPAAEIGGTARPGDRPGSGRASDRAPMS
jgi:hypothetical protein